MSQEKQEAGMYVAGLVHGGVLPSPEVAAAFAEVVIKGLYGELELQKQQPLHTTDQGDTWLIEGGYQEPSGPAGALSWYMVAQKLDAKVVKLGHRLPMNPPVAIKAMIEKAKRDQS